MHLRLLPVVPALAALLLFSLPHHLPALTNIECGAVIDGTLEAGDSDPFNDGSRQDQYYLYVRNLPATVTVQMSTSSNAYAPYIAYVEGSNVQGDTGVGGAGVTATYVHRFEPGAYVLYAGSYAGLPSYPQPYHLTVNCDYEIPTGSTDPSVVLTNLDSSQWHGYGIAPVFSIPAFTFNSGLSAYVGDPSYTFGFFQNHTAMAAPAAGTYLLQATIEKVGDLSAGKTHPECRFRVLRDNNTFSWMADVPELTSNAGYINPLRIYWISDGTTPWKVAVDMLSFSDSHDGGWVISNLTNTLVSSSTSAPAGSDDHRTPPPAALTNLNSTYWEQVAFSGIFSSPTFSTSGGLGMGVDNPTNTFGFWQTKDTMPAPAAGGYWLRLAVAPTGNVAGKRHPELRVRVFRGDNLYSEMGDAVETASGQGFPTTITVPWYSDGATPWRMALDMLAFAPDLAGGYTVTGITLTPIQ